MIYVWALIINRHSFINDWLKLIKIHACRLLCFCEICLFIKTFQFGCVSLIWNSIRNSIEIEYCIYGHSWTLIMEINFIHCWKYIKCIYENFLHFLDISLYVTYITSIILCLFVISKQVPLQNQLWLCLLFFPDDQETSLLPKPLHKKMDWLLFCVQFNSI